MKKTIIILYGPPGVGKLTIGQQLSTKTRFRFFNGHRLADVVHSIFEFGTKEFVNTTNFLWLYLFEQLLKSTQQGIIASFVYGVQTLEGKRDGQFTKKIISVGKRSGAKIHFVKLTCSDNELYKRVQNKSRKRLGKLTSASLLKKIRRNYKVDELIPFVNNTVIDTTAYTPKQTADRIISQLNANSLINR
jgi:shikimate kinase